MSHQNFKKTLFFPFPYSSVHAFICIARRSYMRNPAYIGGSQESLADVLQLKIFPAEHKTVAQVLLAHNLRAFPETGFSLRTTGMHGR